MLISFRATLVYVFEQINEHFWIQGRSRVAKWGSVPICHILEIVKTTAEARYAVFYSLSEGSAGGGYYDVHKIQNMRRELTILAYEMNGALLSVLHGAPLRLRCENELGFKMVKWIAAIEFGTISPTLAPPKAVITKIMSSMDTVCRFEPRSARVCASIPRGARRRSSRPHVRAEAKIKAENSNERSAFQNDFRSCIG